MFHVVGAVVLFVPSPYFIVPPAPFPAFAIRFCALVLYTHPVANVGSVIVPFALSIVNAFVFHVHVELSFLALPPVTLLMLAVDV